MSEVLWWSCLRVCVCSSVRMSDCLSASIAPEQHVQSLPVLCMLPTAVTRSSSGSVAKRYVHVYPILWTTSCLHIVASNRQRQKWRTVKVSQKGTPSIPILPCCSAASFRGNPKVCKMIFCTTPKANKKLSYRRGTARCVVSIEILPIATQQCRNYLYKFWPNRWYEVGDLVWGNAW